MSRPDTKYVAIGEADVAYQVLGDGPSDLLFFNGLGSHVEMAWEDPDIADFLRRLASLRRLIFFDRRGTGASDGVPRNAIPTWEESTGSEPSRACSTPSGPSRHPSSRRSMLARIAILYAAALPCRRFPKLPRGDQRNSPVDGPVSFPSFYSLTLDTPFRSSSVRARWERIR